MNKFKSFSDFGKAFDTLVHDSFLNHRGVLLERHGTGFKLQGRFFPSLRAVEDELDRQYGVWNKTIESKNKNYGK